MRAAALSCAAALSTGWVLPGEGVNPAAQLSEACGTAGADLAPSRGLGEGVLDRPRNLQGRSADSREARDGEIGHAGRWRRRWERSQTRAELPERENERAPARARRLVGGIRRCCVRVTVDEPDLARGLSLPRHGEDVNRMARGHPEPSGVALCLCGAGTSGHGAARREERSNGGAGVHSPTQRGELGARRSGEGEGDQKGGSSRAHRRLLAAGGRTVECGGIVPVGLAGGLAKAGAAHPGREGHPLLFGGLLEDLMVTFSGPESQEVLKHAYIVGALARSVKTEARRKC